MGLVELLENRYGNLLTGLFSRIQSRTSAENALRAERETQTSTSHTESWSVRITPYDQIFRVLVSFHYRNTPAKASNLFSGHRGAAAT